MAASVQPGAAGEPLKLLPHEAGHRLRIALSLTDTSGVTHRGDRIIRALLAGFVIAVAGDLHLFAACGLAIVTAVFFALGNRAHTGLVRTNVSFFVSHIALLRKSAPQRRKPTMTFLRQGRTGIESIRFPASQSLKSPQNLPGGNCASKRKLRRHCACAMEPTVASSSGRRKNRLAPI